LRNRILALGLVVSFVLAAATEAVPCVAAAPGRQTDPSPSFSCHAGAGAASSLQHRHPAPVKTWPARRGGCCDPLQNGQRLCRKACQSVAVLALAPVLPAPARLMERAAPPAKRRAPLFVPAIDHIPLA
jgi:hypothetical protein